MKEFKESFILILVVTLILLISFIIGKGVDFNPEAREACLINPYLMSFYEDQSGNQNHLVRGNSYLLSGDTITAIWFDNSYSIETELYIIWTTDIVTLHEVNKICKELEKRWLNENMLNKPDSLENQLFKINKE